MSTIDPGLLKALPKMRAAGAAVWPVLTCYILHTNIRNRAWPNLDTITRETGFERATVVEAKKWLVEHCALTPVGYQLRLERERLHPRMDVMQVNGTLAIDGQEYRYLTVAAPADQAEVNSSASELLKNKESRTESGQQFTGRTIDSSSAEPDSSTATTAVEEVARPTVSSLYMVNINPNLGSLQIETLMDGEKTFGYEIMKGAIAEAANSKSSDERRYLTVNYIMTIAGRIARGDAKPKGRRGVAVEHIVDASKPVSPLVTQLGASQAELDANPGIQEQLERIYREQGRIH